MSSEEAHICYSANTVIVVDEVGACEPVSNMRVDKLEGSYQAV
jgi:hypothetical protein